MFKYIISAALLVSVVGCSIPTVAPHQTQLRDQRICQKCGGRSYEVEHSGGIEKRRCPTCGNVWGIRL